MPDTNPFPEPTVATDGDISVSYMQTLIQFLNSSGTLSVPALRANATPKQVASAFSSFIDGAKSGFDSVYNFLTNAVNSVNAYQEAKDSLVDIWDQAKKDWQTFIEGRDLDEPVASTGAGFARTSVVLTLREAQEAIETLRIGALKDKVTTIKDDIQTEIDLVKNHYQDLVNGAQAYAGGKISGLAKAGAAFNTFQLAASQVETIARELLDLVEKFDILTQAQDEMESNLLSQGKPQTVEELTVNTRNP